MWQQESQMVEGDSENRWQRDENVENRSGKKWHRGHKKESASYRVSSSESSGESSSSEDEDAHGLNVGQGLTLTYDGSFCWGEFFLKFKTSTDGCSERHKRKLLLMSLEGQALTYASRLSSKDTKSYRCLKKKLAKRFGQDLPATSARQMCEMLKQEPGESVMDYASRVNQLVEQGYPKVDTKMCNQLSVEYFLKGCKDKLMAMKVLERDPKSVDEALQILEKLTHHTSFLYGQNPMTQVAHVRGFYSDATVIHQERDTILDELSNYKAKVQEMEETLTSLQKENIALTQEVRNHKEEKDRISMQLQLQQDEKATLLADVQEHHVAEMANIQEQITIVRQERDTVRLDLDQAQQEKKAMITQDPQYSVPPVTKHNDAAPPTLDLPEAKGNIANPSVSSPIRCVRAVTMTKAHSHEEHAPVSSPEVSSPVRDHSFNRETTLSWRQGHRKESRYWWERRHWRSMRVCHHCGKRGHSSRQCSQLWWQLEQSVRCPRYSWYKDYGYGTPWSLPNNVHHTPDKKAQDTPIYQSLNW